LHYDLRMQHSEWVDADGIVKSAIGMSDGWQVGRVF
jgi:hypothetical protein